MLPMGKPNHVQVISIPAAAQTYTPFGVHIKRTGSQDKRGGGRILVAVYGGIRESLPRHASFCQTEVNDHEPKKWALAKTALSAAACPQTHYSILHPASLQECCKPRSAAAKLPNIPARQTLKMLPMLECSSFRSHLYRKRRHLSSSPFLDRHPFRDQHSACHKAAMKPCL